MRDKERRLGRGLESLIPRRSEKTPLTWPSEGSPGRAQLLSVQMIDPNPFQPRHTFPLAELNELVDSLRTHGLLQPIVVRAAGARFQIIAGERRFRAAMELGWEKIEACLSVADDGQMLEWALIENLQRQDLNPVEKAMAYQQLQVQAQLTQEELASRLGLSRSAVANTLRLLALPEPVKKLLAEARISMGAARALLALENPEEQLRVAERVAAGELTVRQVERLREASPSRTTPSHQQASDPNHKALEDDLMQALGTQVRLHGSLKKGRLSIAYHDPRQLDLLVQHLLAFPGATPPEGSQSVDTKELSV